MVRWGLHSNWKSSKKVPNRYMYVDFFPKENQNILALLVTIWLCLNKMAFKKQKILRREDRDQTNCLLIAWLRYEKGLSNPHTRSFKRSRVVLLRESFFHFLYDILISEKQEVWVPARVFFFPWIFPIIWWQNDANPVKNAFRYPKQNYCAVLVHIVLYSLKLTHETI